MGVLNGLFGFPRKDAGEMGRAVAGRLLRFATNAGRVVSSLISVDASGNLSTPGSVTAGNTRVGPDPSTSALASWGHSSAATTAIVHTSTGTVQVRSAGGLTGRAFVVSGAYVPATFYDGTTILQPGDESYTREVSAVLQVEGYQSGGALDGAVGGFLPPRLTATQRDTIASPATGLIIYNTTAARLEMWDGAAWVGFSTTA